jgi:CspA family cold shock protein
LVTGTVKWFNGVAGYGFIQPDDGTKAIFVSKAAVAAAGLEDLFPGQKLAFEVVKLPGKFVAEKLQLIEA